MRPVLVDGSVQILSHMWNGRQARSFFKRIITRERCGHMSGLLARFEPLASMKSAMRWADHICAL
jgi:hypothetical protein